MTTPKRIKQGITRRRFGKAVGGAAATAFGFQFIPSHAWGQLEKPTLVGIGSGGKGRTDIAKSANAGFRVIGLVDVVDVKKMAEATGRLGSMADTRNRFPDAAFFTDYREMFDKLGDKVDAVTVSTPDHHHFHASIEAMKRGKHVYCQKPLTHGIWEARMMREVAEKTGVKTQMGNQAHANDHMRRVVELIRAGIIGKVKEAHAWTNRPIWPQGFEAPPPSKPVPNWLDWEQWIGPAPWVDYSPRIAPFAWRGWWYYGTGALGDMACHIMDLPYWALLPGSPKSVKAQEEGATELSPPISSNITWEFGPSRYTADEGFKYHWYDGYLNAHFERDGWNLVKESDEYNHPGEDVMEGMDFQTYGSVIVGEKGKLFFNRFQNNWVVKPSSTLDGFEWPEQSISRARDQDNYKEWLDAINGKIDQSKSYFGLAGQLTETVLLGVLAQRVPDTKLKWDAENLEVKGRPDLTKYIHREYRDGWKIRV